MIKKKWRGFRYFAQAFPILIHSYILSLNHNHIYILFQFFFSFCFVFGSIVLSLPTPRIQTKTHAHFICHNIHHNSVVHLILFVSHNLNPRLSLGNTHAHTYDGPFPHCYSHIHNVQIFADPQFNLKRCCPEICQFVKYWTVPMWSLCWSTVFRNCLWSWWYDCCWWVLHFWFFSRSVVNKYVSVQKWNAYDKKRERVWERAKDNNRTENLFNLRPKRKHTQHTYIAHRTSMYNVYNVIQMKKSFSQFDNHIGNSDANQMAFYAYKWTHTRTSYTFKFKFVHSFSLCHTVLPEQGPKITGGRPRYQIGDEGNSI